MRRLVERVVRANCCRLFGRVRMSADSFDAVVIGAGLGGLTAAALLAKAGKRVCVVERNHSVGAASTFKTGALMIEPALHQTADPRNPDEPKHEISKTLGLLDEINGSTLVFFRARRRRRGKFDLPVGMAAARAAMIERFPQSRVGLERRFELMELLCRRRRSRPAATNARFARYCEAVSRSLALRRLARFAG